MSYNTLTISTKPHTCVFFLDPNALQKKKEKNPSSRFKRQKILGVLDNAIVPIQRKTLLLYTLLQPIKDKNPPEEKKTPNLYILIMR